MKYFLDCEFNGFGGEVISLALVSEDDRELYLVSGHDAPVAWVGEHVLPILYDAPETVTHTVARGKYARHIQAFLQSDLDPHIIADWPEDIRHFCDALMLAPGQMIPISNIRFEMIDVDAYPTDLEGAIQHNALWDARALKRAVMG